MENTGVSFGVRRLHSLLGIMPVGAFVVEHAISNSFILRGEDAFVKQVEFLTSFPYLLLIELFFIVLPILAHAGLGFWIWYRGRGNVQQYGYLRNWLYTLQRWTGMIAIVFIGYHFYEMRIATIELGKFMESPSLHAALNGGLSGHVRVSEMVEYFRRPAIAAFYIVGIAATMFHFANGLWNFLIKWGITVGDRSQRISGYACAGFGIAMFVLFMNVLYTFITYKPA